MRKIATFLALLIANILFAQSSLQDVIWQDWENLNDRNSNLLAVSSGSTSSGTPRTIYVRFKHGYRNTICAKVKIYYINYRNERSSYTEIIKDLDPNEIRQSAGMHCFGMKITSFEVVEMRNCDKQQNRPTQEIIFKKKQTQSNRFEKAAEELFNEASNSKSTKPKDPWAKRVYTSHSYRDADNYEYFAAMSESGEVEYVKVTDPTGNEVYRKNASEFNRTNKEQYQSNSKEQSKNGHSNVDGSVRYSHMVGFDCNDINTIYISNVFQYTPMSDNSDIAAGNKIAQEYKKKGICNMRSSAGKTSYEEETTNRYNDINDFKRKGKKIKYIIIPDPLN